MPTFGEILKTLRQAAGLSQSQLARLAGINKQQVSHMETGVRGIGPKSRIRLAKALKLPVEEFNRILAGHGDKNAIRLWLKLHSMPKKDSRKIIRMFLKTLEVYELVRKEQVASDLYAGLESQIEHIVSSARKPKKLPA